MRRTSICCAHAMHTSLAASIAHEATTCASLEARNKPCRLSPGALRTLSAPRCPITLPSFVGAVPIPNSIMFGGHKDNPSGLPSTCELNRLLRDRLIVILEVAADLWSTHRRPWHEGCVWYGIGLTGRQRAVANRKRQRLPAANRPLRPAALAFMEGSYTGVYCLDSGAGPRRFWEAMCGPRFVDATWNIDGQVRG